MSNISAIVIKIIADYLVIPIVIIGVIAILISPRKGWWPRSLKAFLTGIASLLLAGLASLFYQDTRPFLAQGVDAKAAYLINSSFPSLHVLLVFTVTGIVWGATKRPVLTLVLLVLSVMVAIGRIIALVHTPTDVLGGVACAIIAIMVMYGRTVITLRAK